MSSDGKNTGDPYNPALQKDEADTHPAFPCSKVYYPLTKKNVPATWMLLFWPFQYPLFQKKNINGLIQRYSLFSGKNKGGLSKFLLRRKINARLKKINRLK